MPSPALQSILQAVADQRLTVQQALDQAEVDGVGTAGDALAKMAGATVDLGRPARCRFGEVIYGEGKSADLIQAIAGQLLKSGQSVLVTRIAPAAAAQLVAAFEYHRHEPDARTLRLDNRPVSPTVVVERPPALPQDNQCQDNQCQDKQLPCDSDFHVAVVTAGSTDKFVAAEAIETLGWMGVAVDVIEDVGVAGPQRIIAVVPRLRAACAVIVCAGMEGALPSVVGGHVGCPVIAVPTSVGYGSALGGITPMLGMLTSCASNVTVVGIDAGFKGGYVAGLVATQLRDLAKRYSNAASPTAEPSI
jgi:NCAIR mutase (PurE)-related protein